MLTLILRHSINLALFALLAAYATPSAAEQGKPDASRADSCGYVCIFTDNGR